MAPRGRQKRSTDAPRLFLLARLCQRELGGGKTKKGEDRHADVPLHLALRPFVRNLTGIFQRSRFAVWKRHLPRQGKAERSHRLRPCLGSRPPLLAPGAAGVQGDPRALAPCPCAPWCWGPRRPGARRCLGASSPAGKQPCRPKAAICISLLGRRVPAPPAPPCCPMRCRVWLFNVLLFRSPSPTPAFSPTAVAGREAAPAAGLTAGRGAPFPRLGGGTRSCPPSPRRFPWRRQALPAAACCRCRTPRQHEALCSPAPSQRGFGVHSASPALLSLRPRRRGAGRGGDRSAGRRGKQAALAPSRPRRRRAGGDELPAPLLSAGEAIVRQLLFSLQCSEHV